MRIVKLSFVYSCFQTGTSSKHEDQVHVGPCPGSVTRKGSHFTLYSLNMNMNMKQPGYRCGAASATAASSRRSTHLPDATCHRPRLKPNSPPRRRARPHCSMHVGFRWEQLERRAALGVGAHVKHERASVREASQRIEAESGDASTAESRRVGVRVGAGSGAGDARG